MIWLGDHGSTEETKGGVFLLRVTSEPLEGLYDDRLGMVAN